MAFVYALVDPTTGEARYVGVSIHPQRRLREHMSGSGCGMSGMWDWLQALKRAGSVPRVCILHELPGESDGRKFECWVYERRWIRRMEKRGFRLFNDRGARYRRAA